MLCDSNIICFVLFKWALLLCFIKMSGRSFAVSGKPHKRFVCILNLIYVVSIINSLNVFVLAAGSMSGARETVAKAVTLECMRGAVRQNRACFLYAFRQARQHTCAAMRYVKVDAVESNME